MKNCISREVKIVMIDMNNRVLIWMKIERKKVGVIKVKVKTINMTERVLRKKR
jgi:hypothetical protein